MTLSARIAIRPSRRLERLAMALPLAGCVVAAVTLAVRWPSSTAFIALSALAASVAIVASVRGRRAIDLVLTVSRHAEIDVEPDPAGGTGHWCLAESTMTWPGFAMLALRPFDRSVVTPMVRVPVSTAELAASDRRALGRFLIWSMQGETGDDPLSARS